MANISIHAPRAGRDKTWEKVTVQEIDFNPRAPCGARPGGDPVMLRLKAFQSTRPVRGATGGGQEPLHGGNQFQSTRPVRGAT